VFEHLVVYEMSSFSKQNSKYCSCLVEIVEETVGEIHFEVVGIEREVQIEKVEIEGVVEEVEEVVGEVVEEVVEVVEETVEEVEIVGELSDL